MNRPNKINGCESQVSVVKKTNFEDLINQVDSLTPQQRLNLSQHLLGKESGLTVMLGGGNINIIQNSLAIQINGNAEAVFKQISNLPSDKIVTLLDAISLWVKNNRQ